MDHPTVYRFRVAGQPSPIWATWFEGARLTPEPNGDTTMTIELPDQAAVHGLLARVRDLGLPLVSVETVASDAEHRRTSAEHAS